MSNVMACQLSNVKCQKQTFKCQVYVAKEDYDKLTAPDEGETAVLEDMAYELQPTSRLSCQIEVNPNMEGMTFTIAPY